MGVKKLLKKKNNNLVLYQAMIEAYEIGIARGRALEQLETTAAERLNNSKTRWAAELQAESETVPS